MAMKEWEELDVLDNYLINAVASDPDVAEPFFRRLLSVLLQRDVGKIRVEAEKFIPGTVPDRRGIRLDVEVDEYLSDGGNEQAVTNVYDLEPHLRDDLDFPKFMRFRQAKLDSRHMKRNDNEFGHMPDLYVILITNFDVFGKDLMMYTIEQTCREEPDIEYDDGLTMLYFNTAGSRGGSRDIKNMLKYLQDSRDDMAVDEATRELDRYVDSIKSNSVLKGDYMTVGDFIDNERREEREETTARVTKEVTERVTVSILQDGILDLLNDKGIVPEDLRNKICEETDHEKLRHLHLLAGRVQSVEEFAHKIP